MKSKFDPSLNILYRQIHNLDFDPSLNILYRQHHNLDYVFAPKTVALIGATEKPNSVGRTVLWNLLRSPFGGTIFPVNPKRSSILGIKAYPSIDKVPEKIDLAVIVTPANAVPNIIKECVDAKVPAAIIISAGFKEQGEAGLKLEKEILEYAKEGKMRVIGPNCLGVMNPITGLNATFAADCALKGNIAFISQSGALCTAVLDWSLKEKVGFSSFVSIGSMLDINFGDLINYFGSDPNTKSILMYMESVGDTRSFLSAAREVSLTKPIILIKAGKTQESAKAAASHTGSLSGSDAVLNAALKRVGVLRVDSISDLFSMADILSKQPAPKGPNLAILTNAGGPGVIATDALIENGGKLAQLKSETYAKLNSFLPKEWSHNNPVDILGDASPDLYYQSMQALMQDKNCDGVLVILTPQYMTDANAIAEKLKSFAHSNGKPVLASFMGADAVSKASKELATAGIPTFEYPDSACKAFTYMLSYAYSLRGIYETPVSDIKDLSAKEISKRQKLILNLFDEAYDDKRVLLDEFESKEVLKAYGLPVVDTYIAQSKKEARACAEKIGFPVVLKLFSKTITHKTDVGGVKLNLNNADAVEKAYQEIFDSVKKLGFEKDFQGVSVQPMIKLDGYEIILGSSVDKEFGPIILFGTGGRLVEVFKDRAIGLPPLNSTLAKRLMERTKIYEALKGVRGRKGVDLNRLEQILVKFSNLIADYPQIKECDINPLIVSETNIIAVDARIILHEQKDINKLPKLAIRPYPINYVQDWTLKNKKEVTIRPIKPEDEPAIANFIKDLSEKTIRQRYLQTLLYDELLGHEKLIQICFNDYDREIALVAELKNEKREKEILAVGRLTKLAHTNDAAFAILVKDAWHGQGLGKKLLTSLIEIAKNEKVELLLAQMFTENVVMRKLCSELGFKLTPSEDKLFISAELDLNG